MLTSSCCFGQSRRTRQPADLWLMSPPCGQIHVNLHNRYHSFKEGCYPSGTAVTCQHICNGVHQNCKTQRKEKGDGKIFSYKITLNILVDGVTQKVDCFTCFFSYLPRKQTQNLFSQLFICCGSPALPFQITFSLRAS